MHEELKDSLITVLEGIKQSFASEDGQQWYIDFCKAIEELKKSN